MPRDGDDTRRRIVNAAYEFFYRDGFARANVDAIAESAGVTKRTLYNHFESKDALVAAVLDLQHELMLSRVDRWAARARGDAAAFVELLFAELASWSAKPGWLGSGFSRITMELADLPGHPARAAAHRHKAAVEARLAEELARSGVGAARDLARELMLLLGGCMTLLLIHRDPAYVAAAGRAGRVLVMAATAPAPRR